MYQLEEKWESKNNIKLDYLVGFSYKSEWERELNENA